jgi:hypothetical protein
MVRKATVARTMWGWKAVTTALAAGSMSRVHVPGQATTDEPGG